MDEQYRCELCPMMLIANCRAWRMVQQRQQTAAMAWGRCSRAGTATWRMRRPRARHSGQPRSLQAAMSLRSCLPAASEPSCMPSMRRHCLQSRLLHFFISWVMALHLGIWWKPERID